jgi:hypothetical protein
MLANRRHSFDISYRSTAQLHFLRYRYVNDTVPKLNYSNFWCGRNAKFNLNSSGLRDRTCGRRDRHHLRIERSLLHFVQRETTPALQFFLCKHKGRKCN